MVKKLLLTALIAACVCALARPADAAVTASLSNPVAPSSTVCPYNLTFSGTISGPAGTNVTYWFGRFNIPGPSHTQPISTSIPQTGALNVTDSIQMTAALANGTTYQDQIYVSTANAYSNTVSFKPTCTSIPQKLRPPAPTDLSATADRSICAYYVAPLFCNAGIGAGNLALIFKWSPGNGYKSLDGYKLYRLTGGGQTFVEQSSATEVTRALFTTNYAGQCFVVTAYQGSNESSPSNTFCTPNGYGPK